MAFANYGEQTGSGPSVPYQRPPDSGDRTLPGQGDDSAQADVRFAKLLALLGVAILGLGALLLALPVLLEGSFLVYLIADGIAFLFAPVGFTLIAAAVRIHNRARHGTEMPPAHRRRVRMLGLALVGIGLFVAFSGFGATGTISRTLNLIWGFSLALYGVRFLFRSLVSDHS